MKTMSRLKKVVALGMGLSMVGATLFGASAASLSELPAPFVKEGKPSSNLKIVVGDQATGEDIIGVGDLTAWLQQQAVEKKAIGGSGGRVQLRGDAYQVGSPTDLLEIGESIGNVRPTLDEANLKVLQGGSITTQGGVTKYNQYLSNPDFGADSNSSKVIFAEDEFDNVGHYLFWTDGQQIVEWKLEFEEGLVSRVGTQNVTDAALADLNDRELKVLGVPYTVVKTEFDARTTSANRQGIITLLGGPVYDSLGEGDKKTFTLNGKEYEVEVVVISETASEVLLKVNGEQLPRMKTGNTEPTSDGTLLGIRDIIATGKDTQSSVVRFYLGASRLEIKDTIIGDALFTVGGVQVNNEIVEDVQGRISATMSSDGTRFTLSDIRVNITSDALVGDMYVPPGHGVREYLDEPESLLSPNWDLKYEGLTDTGVTTIKVNPVGRDEYKLEFVNQEGLHYVIPYMTARQGSGTTADTIKMGDVSGGSLRQLHFNEVSNSGVIPIATNDFFVVSDISSTAYQTGTTDGINGTNGVRFTPGHTDNTAFTRVLKYESIDATNNVLTFTDLATGTKQVTFSERSTAPQINTSSLVVAGNTYSVIVSGNQSLSGGGSNLSIDLNGDGTFAGAAITSLVQFAGGVGGDLSQAVVATEGGALIILANSNQSATADATKNFSITTLTKQFDESTADEVLVFNAETRSGSRIGINRAQTLGVNLLFLTSEPEVAQGLTNYGTFAELFDPLTTDTPEELTIEYPLSQRGAQVFFTGGAVESSKSEGGMTEKVNPLPVGLSVLAKEVSDATKLNAIVIGGPCANSVAAGLLGNPKDCAEGFEEGKALVKLVEHANGNVALLVAGFSGADTRRAARSVLTGDVQKVKGKEAVVSGRSLSDIKVSAA